MYINMYISYTYIPIYILNSREISFSSIFLVLTTKDTAKKKKKKKHFPLLSSENPLSGTAMFSKCLLKSATKQTGPLSRGLFWGASR